MECFRASVQVFERNFGLLICYKGFPCVVEGYSDANWITDSSDVKSTSGYVFLLGRAAISWASKKQTIISRSTMESELIALDIACTEAKWIKNFSLEMPLVNKPIPAFSIHCDNKAVMDLVRQAYTNKKVVSLEFMKSEKNNVDQLTKGLSKNAVPDMSRGMGLSP